MATIETSSPGEAGAVSRLQVQSPVFSRGRYIAGLLSILAGLALWEFLSRVVVANALFLAAPSQIFEAIWQLAASGELWPHIAISAVEFALGYAIASLVGIATGLAMAQSEVAKN